MNRITKWIGDTDLRPTDPIERKAFNRGTLFATAKAVGVSAIIIGGATYYASTQDVQPTPADSAVTPVVLKASETTSAPLSALSPEELALYGCVSSNLPGEVKQSPVNSVDPTRVEAVAWTIVHETCSNFQASAESQDRVVAQIVNPAG